jgi:transglutaminase-like putative cysteine protease
VSRRAIAAVVVAGWLVSLGLLIRREYWRPRAEVLAEGAARLPPGAAYYAVRLGPDQIGYASSTIDTLGDTLTVNDIVVLEIPVLGTLQRTEARTEIALTRGLRLRSFTAFLRSENARFDASGRIEGDSVLVLDLAGADSRETRRIPLTEPLVLPQLLPLEVALGGTLRPGRSFTAPVFDPLLLATRRVHVTVVAESTFVIADSAVFDSAAGRFVPIPTDTVRGWQLRETRGDVPLDTWVDIHGQVIRLTSPMGFRIERAAFEIAYEDFRRREEAAAGAGAGPGGGGRPELVRQTAIASNVTLDPDTVALLRVRLDGQPLGGLDLDGDRQHLVGDTLTVRREGPTARRASYRLPAAPAALRPFLQPEPLVQSDDPRLQAQARQIIGRTRRPERAAELLTRWVHEHLAPAVTVSVPSALDVYDSRRGDCNEHTVLFVALARAVGLPARTAAGLVYLDGTFYYHAWAEVYLNGWVAVDPTFGQFPADAAHLRFTIGGLARQLELIRLIGRLTIHVMGTDSLS